MNQLQKDILKKNGWSIQWENPLEIRNDKTGDLAEGVAAEMVLKSLLNLDNREDKKYKIDLKKEGDNFFSFRKYLILTFCQYFLFFFLIAEFDSSSWHTGQRTAFVVLNFISSFLIHRFSEPKSKGGDGVRNLIWSSKINRKS